MGKLVNWIKNTAYISIGALIVCSLIEPTISEKTNEKKFGKEYTFYRQSIDSAFLSNLNSIKRNYIMSAYEVNKKSPQFQELKKDYQKKENSLTKKRFNDIKNLENSLRK